MIDSILLRQFKCFRVLHLQFGDLTILTGANNSGKTSVIHALMLFRQAARSAAPVVRLNDEQGLSLGEALDVLHRGLTEHTVEVRVNFREETTASVLVLGLPDERVLYERALYLNIECRPGISGDEQGLTTSPPNFTYLCAERLGPRDALSADSADVNAIGVGIRGEYTAQVLALGLSRRHRVAAARWAPSTPDVGGVWSQLERQVARWMSIILGLDGIMEIDAEWFPGTTVTRLRFKMPGQVSEWTRPPNMGFGVSYVLPIVVSALLTPPGGLLIVENPEAHLHPAGQSMIGEFLARMAADGVQVVVETHSDHVVNGVRRAVAEKKAALDADRVALHYFGGGGTSGDGVTSIGLRDSGDLTAWPRGFFDQIERDLGAIARTRRRRP